jgi:hypothetical protein
MPFYFDPDVHFLERHDPNPERNYPVEYQRRFEEETERQRALVDAWRSVPMHLRQRAIERGWFRPRDHARPGLAAACMEQKGAGEIQGQYSEESPVELIELPGNSG